MTHDPPPEPPPSIYTRLDGSPLPHHQPPAPPAIPGAPLPTAAAPVVPGAAAWGGLTPQAVAGQRQYVLATWSSRLGAYLLDAILFGILAWLIVVPIGVAFGLTIEESAEFFVRVAPLPESIVDPTPFRIAVVAQALIPGIALALALLRMDGQTPGKRALGIRVVRADGQPMDSRTAFRREVLVKTILLGLLALLTLFLGWLLNYLWPLWDREHRAGHDIAVGTRVVQAPRDR